MQKIEIFLEGIEKTWQTKRIQKLVTITRLLYEDAHWKVKKTVEDLLDWEDVEQSTTTMETPKGLHRPRSMP